jgi:uncharacterized membrane protein HdeD (DUF308 family)
MLKACGRCGVEFETLQGKYAPDGTIVCVPCGEALAQAAKGLETKSASSAFVGAFGSLLIALLSFVFEHKLLFFLFPVLAMAGGAGTAYTALRSERAREALGWKRIPTMVVGLLAVLLGLLSLFASLAG